MSKLLHHRSSEMSTSVRGVDIIKNVIKKVQLLKDLEGCNQCLYFTPPSKCYALGRRQGWRHQRVNPLSRPTWLRDKPGRCLHSPQQALQLKKVV